MADRPWVELVLRCGPCDVTVAVAVAVRLLAWWVLWRVLHGRLAGCFAGWPDGVGGRAAQPTGYSYSTAYMRDRTD